MTVDGIVNEIGTTRQTFYLRYRNMAMLSLEIVLDRCSTFEEADTGKLESDLLQLQRNVLAHMTSPLIQKNLLGLLNAIHSDVEAFQLFQDGMILPRQQNVGRILSRAVGRGEISGPLAEAEYVCDLMFGPLLARVLVPTDIPLGDRFARRLVTTTLNELH